jgi:thiamine-monophosphate kinase
VLRLRPGHEFLVTTDFSLEGIHFRRDWHPPEAVGHRCLARGLSDIAAMGGEPVAAFLSLALPRDLPQAWVERLMRGLISLGEKHGVRLAGGDTAESRNGILADIVVVGTIPRGKSVLRSGARPGDRIFVSGELGGSAAALLQLRRKPKQKLNPRSYLRHFYPEPRVPRARVGKPSREIDLDLALHGGEDYELLFTVPGGKRVPSQIAGVTLSQIGVITRSTKILVTNSKGIPSGLEARGWEHFRR